MAFTSHEGEGIKKIIKEDPDIPPPFRIGTGSQKNITKTE